MSREDREALAERLSQESGDRIVIIPNALAMAREQVLYQCDRRACERCDGSCGLTSDIAHAVNFRRGDFGGWIEDHEPG